MTRRLPDVTEVTTANVDNDAVLVRSESRGFVRRILLKHLFGGLPLLRGASRALQKTGALVSRGDGNADLTVRIDGDDNGSGRGAQLAVGGNRNEQSPAPGVWRLQDAAGVWCTLYVDDNGVLRITRAAAVTALNPRPGREVREIAGFELHDGVTTELTTIAGADRFFVSAEMEIGAPHRYFEAADMLADMELRESYPTTTLNFFSVGNNLSATFAHNLGRIPKLILGRAVFRKNSVDYDALVGPPGWYEYQRDSAFPVGVIQIQPTSLTATAATIFVSSFYKVSASNPRYVVIDAATGDLVVDVGLHTIRFQFFG